MRVVEKWHRPSRAYLPNLQSRSDRLSLFYASDAVPTMGSDRRCAPETPYQDLPEQSESVDLHGSMSLPRERGQTSGVDRERRCQRFTKKTMRDSARRFRRSATLCGNCIGFLAR